MTAPSGQSCNNCRYSSSVPKRRYAVGTQLFCRRYPPVLVRRLRESPMGPDYAPAFDWPLVGRKNGAASGNPKLVKQALAQHPAHFHTHRPGSSAGPPRSRR